MLPKPEKPVRRISATGFMRMLEVNATNKEGMSDASFREFVNNVLPIVIYSSPAEREAEITAATENPNHDTAAVQEWVVGKQKNHRG